MPPTSSLVARFSPPRATEVRLPDGRLVLVRIMQGDAIEVARLERLVGSERATAESDLRARDRS